MKRHTVTVHVAGLVLAVTLTTWGASRGARDSYGAPLEPDEPAGYEIDKVELVEVDDDTDIAMAIEDELERMGNDYE